ncbi:MAG: DUF885 domain-containing protein [Deltaproteobacteria bacterium]|nr:DUF885 domain-containing protein [Deltaproteobacteria bacterium]
MLALLASSLLLAAAPTPPVSPVAPLARQYMDGLFKARPHLATFMGDHSHDAELIDLSDAATKRRLGELTTLAKQVAALDRSKLSADDRADAQILADGIALETLYLAELHEPAWDPRFSDSFPFYDPREIIASRLGDLIHGAYATEAQRREWVTAELLALPKLIAQEQALVTAPSLIHLEQAVKDNAGRIGFFETELKEFTAKDPAGEAARLAALKSLQGYQDFLTKFPREKATHDWKLGKKLYAKKFPLALQTNVKQDELYQRARTAFLAARGELFQSTLRLKKELWPKEPPVPAAIDNAGQAALIRRVEAELSKAHPKGDALVQAHADQLNALRDFITQKNLLALPPAETLAVEPMPEFKRGGAGAEYLSPGMLDKTVQWKGTFFVDPPDASWSAEKTESYLRANNDLSIVLTAAHEAYPGHHLQAWYARKDLNPLRSTLWSGAFAEGWAVYGTTLLVRSGLGGATNERLHFEDTKVAMIVAANAILDLKLQTGEMSDAEALAFMENDGFQEKALAENKLRRANLDSTQLCQYFLGLSEIEALEKEVRAKGPFDQRAFDEALVGHGTIPVKVLRGLVLGRN